MQWRVLWMLLIVVFAIGCGGAAPVEEPTANDEETAVSTNQEAEQPVAEVAAPDPVFIPLTDSEITADMQVILATSEIVVGPNRFAVGLLTPDNAMLHEADVFLRFFDVSDANSPQLESEMLTTAVSAPDGSVTLFTVNRDFTRAGAWGVEVQARFPDQTAGLQRVSFSVAESSAALLPGAIAPSVQTPTLATVEDELSLLSTAPEPNPAFYELSLSEALANDKPTLLYLGTPAFCSSRVCGPGYVIYNELFETWGEEVNFVQVEVFDGLPDPSANGWALTEAMMAFGLTTEPWLYFIESDGTIAYRIEGLFGVEEVSQQLTTLR